MSIVNSGKSGYLFVRNQIDLQSFQPQNTRRSGDIYINGSQSKSKVDRNVNRRVERKNFKLTDLVGLGPDAVVCKAPSAGSENEEIICCN